MFAASVGVASSGQGWTTQGVSYQRGSIRRMEPQDTPLKPSSESDQATTDSANSAEVEDDRAWAEYEYEMGGGFGWFNRR